MRTGNRERFGATFAAFSLGVAASLPLHSLRRNTAVSFRARTLWDIHIVCSASHMPCKMTVSNAQSHNFPLHESQKKITYWHVLSSPSSSKGRHWIFHSRQGKHATLVRSMGSRRPRGTVKVSPSLLLMLFEDTTVASVKDVG